MAFVFQNYNLIEYMTPKENVLLTAKEDPMPILKSLGIGEEEARRNVLKLSGGQQQRVAIARAIASQAPVILADEPTGALDSRASEQLLSLFSKVNGEGQTILMVTHSIQAASKAGRVLFIKDGQVFHQIYRGDMSNDQMYQKISTALTALATGGGNRA